MNTNQEKVLSYYRHFESWLGYRFITNEAKHFGYYPHGKADRSEEEAQQGMSDLVGKNLDLQAGQTVLDAGCGYGVTARFLAKKYGAHITGIDLNQYELGVAQKRAEQEALTDLTRFMAMDYTQLSFPKNSFDAIYTLETLSHSPDIHKTLKGFLKTLKPSGKIALFEYTLAPAEAFSEQELKMLQIGIEGTAALGLEEFKHNQFPDLLREAGFKNVKEQNITANMLPSLFRLKRFATLPYIFVNGLNLQKHFVNTTIAVEWYKLMKKDLIRYCVFTAEK